MTVQHDIGLAMNRVFRVTFFLATFAAFAIPGCGDSGDNGGGAANDFVEEDLELQDNARVIEATLRDEALISSDKEADEYVFDAQALASAGVEIATGDVLLIAEQALIRVTSTTTRGDELVVTGEDAMLPDLIENGRLAWDLALDSESMPAPTLLIGDKEVAPKANGTGGSINYSTMVGEFSISVKVTPNSAARQLEVELVVSSSSGGGEFRAVANGKVRMFRHALAMDISGGRTTNWSFDTNDMDVEIDLELAGANIQTVQTAFVLPGPFQLRFPIPTSLPLGLNVAVTFNVVAEVDLPILASASTQLTARYRYRGNAGFRQSGMGGFTPAGGSSTSSVEVSEPNTAGSTGGIGFSLGVSAPRIVLNALFDVASARLDNIYSVGGTLLGTVMTGLCVQSGASHKVTGTVKAEFFGITLGEFSHDFVDKDLYKQTGDDCPEE
jgi:hypothetical protein